MAADTTSATPEPEDTPETLFAAWLDGGGDEGAQTFPELCSAHPDLLEDLQRLHRLWKELGSVRVRMRGAGSIAARLSKRFGKDVDPHVSLDLEADEHGPTGKASKDVIERLAGREQGVSRYRIWDKIAQGGMGEVLRVWDGDLRRKLAMKVMLGKLEGESGTDSKVVTPSTLKRFLEEAQITGQLDHPGIVPVHELGLDAHGRLFFTMKLVKGSDLGEIFELVHEGREAWSLVRALNVLLRVCEAMSYAHAKGVIHRDLKPPNVMVGRFGEVYVMDWGLAKVLSEPEERDIRIRQPAQDMLTRILTLGADDNEDDSALVTMDGDVVGTPSYMPPEQAAGRLDEMGPHSDVYAMGAMIYHLLVGHMPFVPPGARVRALAVLLRVQEDGPRPVHELAPDAPAELVAICEKAMARDPSDRYADMSRLGADLSAYLEGRVVEAYETGAWAEGRKWVRRNKPLAASLAAALVLFLGGAIAVSVVQASGKATALRESARAEREKQRAEETAEQLLSLSDGELLDDLVADAADAWPAAPDQLEQLRELLGRGEELVFNLSEHRRTLAEMRAGSLPYGDEAQAKNRANYARAVELAELRIEMDRLETLGFELEGEQAEASEATLDRLSGRITMLVGEESDRRIWEFETTEAAWQHRKQTELVENLSRLSDPEQGLLGSGIGNAYGWGLARRIEFAESLVERSNSSAQAAQAWDEATRSIADRALNPHYAGLRLEPQLGLLPLGQDRDSGLWEFAHLASGEPPLRDGNGKLSIEEGSCIVLVLIPGATTTYGAQAFDPGRPNYDLARLSNEQPLGTVLLDPYFISKYEMTQGQWLRVTGENPSFASKDNWGQGWSSDSEPGDLTIPVESVTWYECMEVMRRLDLRLPTEVQWEHAARAGSEAPYVFGPDVLDLAGHANILDGHAAEFGFELLELHVELLNDGATTLMRVGSYGPNAFGLHDVIGNVGEYCLDRYSLYGKYEAVAGSGLRLRETGPSDSAVRGTSFLSTERGARVSARGPQGRGVASEEYGLRPARGLDD